MAKVYTPNQGDGFMKKKNEPLLQMSIKYAAMIIGGSFFTGIAKCWGFDWIILILATLAIGYMDWTDKHNREFDLAYRIKSLWLSGSSTFILIWCDLIGFPTYIMPIMLFFNFLIIYAQAFHKAKYDPEAKLRWRNMLASFVVLLVSGLILCSIFQPFVDQLCSGIWDEYRTFQRANEDIIGCILIQSCYICLYTIPFNLSTSALKFVLSNKAFVYDKKRRDTVFSWTGLLDALDSDFNKILIGSECKNCEKIMDGADKVLSPQSQLTYR